MTVQLFVKPPHVLFECPEADHHRALQVGFWDGRRRAYKAPFDPETLIRIKRVFPESVVEAGQEYIDELKSQYKALNNARQQMSNYHGPRVQVFRIDPKQHQWEGFDYLQLFDSAALFADCGTGKTFTTLMDIRQKIDNNLIPESSVLIVGKLMTLHSGWASDAEKFTGMTSSILWEPSKSTIVKGEIDYEHDHGKGPDKVPKKVFTKTEYFHKDGTPAILAGPRAFNPRTHVAKQRRWFQKGDVKCGRETLATINRKSNSKENIRERIRDVSRQLHIINHEGLLNHVDELAERNYQYIVLDESTVIKGAQSKTLKALMKISANSKYRRILTGTPTPQGMQDLWGQFYFLDRGMTFGSNYEIFLKKHFNFFEIRGTRVQVPVPKRGGPGVEGTKEYVDKMLHNRVYTKRLSDCIDLPETSVGIIDVFLTPELRRHYEEMKSEMHTEIGDEIFDVTTDFAKIGKLRQITGGFLLNKEKEVVRLVDQNPKMNALLSYLEEIGSEEKIVIFAIFRCEIELLIKTFGNKCRSIYGGTKDTDKIKAQADFINDPSVKYLICQPQSAAHGINGLTVSRHLIFYSIDYRADTDHQSRRRLERTGQTRGVIIKYLLAKDTIDEIMYKAVMKKKDLQELLIYKEIIGK